MIKLQINTGNRPTYLGIPRTPPQMFPHHRGRNILHSSFLVDVELWGYLWYKTVHVDIPCYTAADHIPKQECAWTTQLYYFISISYMLSSCLFLTPYQHHNTNISHCLVFCHTLPSTDRQPPLIFSSWPSHLMVWIHYITGGFVTVQIM